MSVDPMYRPDLGREIAELKRRLDAIERSPSLGNSSIVGGAMRVLDADGQERVRVGVIGGGTDYGVIVSDEEGTEVLKATKDGLVKPYTNVAFSPFTAGTEVDGSVWGSYWDALVDKPWTDAFVVRVHLSTGALVAASLRCMIVDLNAPIPEDDYAISQRYDVPVVATSDSRIIDLAWSPAMFSPEASGPFWIELHARVPNPALDFARINFATLRQGAASDVGATASGAWSVQSYYKPGWWSGSGLENYP